MKTISIINNKGGVGKTTTALNFGYELAVNFGKRVLFVDLDGQGSLSQILQQEDIPYQTTVADVLLGKVAAKKAICETPYENLHIIPAGSSLDDIYESLTSDIVLKDALYALEDEYDYCIIDNAPAISIGTYNSLMASDEVLVPMCIDVYGFWGLNRITNVIQEVRQKNQSLYFLGCLITQYEKNDLTQNVKQQLENQENYPIFDTAIRRSKKVCSSTFERQPISIHSKRSATSVDYHKMTKEYLEGKLY